LLRMFHMVICCSVGHTMVFAGVNPGSRCARVNREDHAYIQIMIHNNPQGITRSGGTVYAHNCAVFDLPVSLLPGVIKKRGFQVLLLHDPMVASRVTPQLTEQGMRPLRDSQLTTRRSSPLSGTSASHLTVRRRPFFIHNIVEAGRGRTAFLFNKP
jgi:hypothetical protein